MTDLLPAPVPELSATWVDQRREALVGELLRPRRRTGSIVGLAGVTAAASAVATIVVTVGGGTTDAFAGWSATPTTPATGQVQTAQATCQALLAQAVSAQSSTAQSGTDQSGTGQPANETVQAGEPSNRPLPAGPYQPLVSDVRGPFTLTILGVDGVEVAQCLTSPGASSLRIAPGPVESPAAGTIGLDNLTFMIRDGERYTLAEGPVGPGVTGATLVLADGSSVATTVGNGYFIAWWPGTQAVTSVEVASASGTTTQTVDLPGPPAGGAPPTK